MVSLGKSQNSLDQLQYNYIEGTNQLQYISDGVNNSADATDLENQASTNYAYNAIGQLSKDEAEGIAKISWHVNGKIKSVEKSDGSGIRFIYDAMGYRIKKISR